MKKIITILILLTTWSYADEIYYYQSGKKIQLTPIQPLFRTLSKRDYYTNSSGTLLGVSDRLLVKLQDRSYLKNILQEYKLTLLKEIDANLFLCKTQDKNLTIQIANTLTKKDFVKYAHPDFMKKLYRR